MIRTNNNPGENPWIDRFYNPVAPVRTVRLPPIEKIREKNRIRVLFTRLWDNRAWYLHALSNSNLDFETAWTNCPVDALSISKEFSPHFIFIAIGEDTRSGFELLAIIRQTPELKNAKVFIIGDPLEEIEKMARLLGASGCINACIDVEWMTHNFKAIFDGQLLPDFVVLRRVVSNV